ncbi:MAG: zf-TFIIB domain-containing protein [Bdellovibrionota bacterium]
MQCPSCQKEVSVQDKDVGALFTCPQCRSVYFINFDGTPEYGDVDQPSAEELKKLQNQNIPEKKKKKKKDKNDADEFETQSAEMEVPAIELAPVETPAFEMQPEPLPIEAFPTENPSIENFSYESQSVESESPSPQQASIAQDFASIASEIEAFGNQQTSVAGISYDLEITGLDTKQSQELLREAIDDSRFGWHPDDLVREIRTGTCHFKNLTPVQAFVLARRIQFIDVDMKWKQNVLA